MKTPIVIVLIVVIASASIAGFLVLKGIFSSPSTIQYQYSVSAAFPNLSFNSPVGIYNAGDGSNRLFVIEQAGVIKVFENNETTTTATVFLDISSQVLSGGELGLLGMAFHPNFTSNGYFYVDYTADSPMRSIISRFQVSSGNVNQTDPTSEFILLQVEQPFANHNGGQIAFGPDGYLYIALGDGGGAGDPLGNAQNRSTLLGSILRIDVNSQSAGLNYSIPADNPFFGNSQDYREEIYAYGLRNPWRFSFDPATAWLWAGDVGQDRIEEIDIIEKGKNYGWNITEGTLCYSPQTGCNQTGLELPIWEYNHTLGYAVTGGFVYRGTRLPELTGNYIYADYGSGRIWALHYNGTGAAENTELVDTSLNIPSLGIDEQNELYICAFDGGIYRLQVLDNVPPVIGSPLQTPQNPTLEEQVQVSVNVTDAASGVQSVILSFNNDTIWTNLTMTHTGGSTYTTNITAMPYQTNVQYRIIASDNANNSAVNDNQGSLYTYVVIPELPSSLTFVLVFSITTVAIIFLKNKKKQDADKSPLI